MSVHSKLGSLKKITMINRKLIRVAKLEGERQTVQCARFTEQRRNLLEE